MKLIPQYFTGNRPLQMHVDPSKVYLPAGTTPVAITKMCPEDVYIWAMLKSGDFKKRNCFALEAGWVAQAVQIMDRGQKLEPFSPVDRAPLYESAYAYFPSSADIERSERQDDALAMFRAEI